jgi:hypothetical protein
MSGLFRSRIFEFPLNGLLFVGHGVQEILVKASQAFDNVRLGEVSCSIFSADIIE